MKFISFDDIRSNPNILDTFDVIINVGDGDTAHTGGYEWEDAMITSTVRGFVHNGGGFIGVGEPTGHQFQGHYLQLANVMGVEKETGFTLGYDKYNWEQNPNHFILQDVLREPDFGEGKKNIYALPYFFENSRVLYRAILWATHSEKELKKWYSTNYNVDVHAFLENNKYCVVNNTYEPQDTIIYTTSGLHWLPAPSGRQCNPLVLNINWRNPYGRIIQRTTTRSTFCF